MARPKNKRPSPVAAADEAFMALPPGVYYNVSCLACLGAALNIHTGQSCRQCKQSGLNLHVASWLRHDVETGLRTPVTAGR
jgi:hypothetical protein